MRYQTTCSFGGPQESHFQHDCHIALFSFKQINFSGKLIATENNFCGAVRPESDMSDLVRSQNFAVMVKRGTCAFSTKALHAQKAGFQLVIIANSEEEGFPVGPPELDFVLGVPVVMVGQKVWEQVYDSHIDRTLPVFRDDSSAVDKSGLVSALEDCYTVSLSFGMNILLLISDIRSLTFCSSLFYTAPALSPAQHTASPASSVQPGSSDRHKLHSTVALNIQMVRVLFVIAAVASVIVLVIVFYSTLQHNLLTPHSLSDTADSNVDTGIPTTSYAPYLVQTLVYMLIVTVFVGVRLGTLRIYSTTDPLDSAQVVYNHRETDERVFEV